MPARPFMDFLREQRRGLMHDELSDALNDLIAKISETGKGGELVVTFTIKPINNETGGAVSVQDEIIVKPPKELPPASVFFVTPENNLSRTDANQRRLDLKDVKAGAKGDMTIPQVFTLGLAPYQGANAYKIEARLRYRLDDGKVKFSYSLERVADLVKHVIDDFLVEIMKVHEDKIIFGIPITGLR